MALQLGDTAPDFEAETTEGPIRFHEWLGDSWAVMFSHPKDFTPVCTTELGYVAKIKPEFDKRGVKLIGLSVDPVEMHEKWVADIKDTQGSAVNYPMIGDPDLMIAKLYGMLPAVATGTSDGRRQPDRPERLHHRSGQEDQTDPDLPNDHGAQFRRGAAGNRFDATHRQASRGDARELDAR
jgi:peroxiredoxin